MSVARTKPVAGYASKTAAVLALRAEGKSYEEIAGVIGSTVKSAQNLYSLGKKAAASAAGPGIWTPEKIDKARRLFGKTMIMIADALQVPADELLTYALNGKVPPMGRNGRIGDLRNKAEAEAPEPGVGEGEPAPLRLAPPVAVAAEEPEPPIVQVQYRLQSETGAWLHRDLSRVTYRIAEAWRGGAPDIERVYAGNPRLKKYDAVRVP